MMRAFDNKLKTGVVLAGVLFVSALAAGQGMGPPAVSPATPPPQILNNIEIDCNEFTNP